MTLIKNGLTRAYRVERKSVETYTIHPTSATYYWCASMYVIISALVCNTL